MKYSRTAKVIMPDGSEGTAPMREDGLIDMTKAVAAPVKGRLRSAWGPDTSRRRPLRIRSLNNRWTDSGDRTSPDARGGNAYPGGGKTSTVVPVFLRKWRWEQGHGNGCGRRPHGTRSSGYPDPVI